MSTVYPKMKNLFGLDGQPNCHVVWFLRGCMWRFYEKLDGMNIRVIYDENGEKEVRGRTDRAVLPGNMAEVCLRATESVKARNLIIYGEGYGGKVQKGYKYSPTFKFAAFDVLDTEEGRWWDQKQVKELPVPHAPLMHIGDLWSGAAWVVRGVESTFGPFLAEGFVARPDCDGLRMYGGNLIRAKLKHRDLLNKPELLDLFIRR